MLFEKCRKQQCRGVRNKKEGENAFQIERGINTKLLEGNMKKSDSELQQDVQQELKYELSTRAAQIGVTAKDGIVGLTGNVHSYAAKYAVVHAAERVAGVKAVTGELKVDLPAFHVRNDEDIARAAVNALEWDVWVPANRIKVKVDGGWITLEGRSTAGIHRRRPKTLFAI